MTGRHQTIRIGRGSHSSPLEGACVMELASLLAGEPFSDHPECACPVVSAYLRTWNDGVSYAFRQRLFPYAALVVGTRGDRDLVRQRMERCVEWSGVALAGRGRLGRRLALARMRFRILAGVGVVAALRLREGAAIFAARRALATGDHGLALARLEELVSMGNDEAPGVNLPPAPAVDGPRAAATPAAAASF